ncbi:MmgE/PrpD family protein [Agrobacterium rhizogenes]|uniref:MmgE/PrpD family protein n=1 Tax=Rhizobium rhizogenes TaxID=359 RepID=UPI00157391E0|nr:MmgE/PrpD family protein [Rhizobium rhizogenes]NTG45780.1 MmgE/PrpD family protein [Rhizobium rhizogenes]
MGFILVLHYEKWENSVYTSEKLGELIASTERFPPSALDAARRCILDAVSAAVGGLATTGAVAAAKGATLVWGRGQVPLWLSSSMSTAMGAAFANSAATSMLDIDDGHRAAAGHPGASIIPAVFAAVHEDPSLQDRALGAIIVGYEIGLRIAASRDLRTLDTVNSGRWCGQGVAAALGWLRKLPPQVISHAISAAGTIAPHMPAAEFTQVGNHIKEAIPHATANGIMCLRLAEAGYAAPLDLLDDDRHFNSAKLLQGFGERWMIETSYFKPYSCCRWIHAPIDGLLKILARQGLAPADISGIRVETFRKGVETLNNQVSPKSLEAAQFSTPFCLGVVATRGVSALLPMTDFNLLTDPNVLSLAERVEVVLDVDLDSYFSAAVPARILVTFGDTTFTETVMEPLGEPGNPMSWDMLFEKFHALSSSQLTLAKQKQLHDALLEMKDGSLERLLWELSQPN